MGNRPLTLFILVAAVLVYLYLAGRQKALAIAPAGPATPSGGVTVPPDGGYGYGGKEAYDEWQEYLRAHPNPFPKFGNYAR